MKRIVTVAMIAVVLSANRFRRFSRVAYFPDPVDLDDEEIANRARSYSQAEFADRRRRLATYRDDAPDSI